MKKIFTVNLCIYMIIALFVTVAAIFIFQTIITEKDNTAASEEKLLIVKEKLRDNDAQIENLLESINENSLAKARALAVMINDNPSILNDQEALFNICSVLAVDELHVIDSDGILRWGSEEKYLGFDFHSGEQTIAFLEILDDPTMELAQEPLPNTAEGIYFQYTGVARIDEPGIVQVGLRAEVLEHLLENTEISKVLSLFEVGNTGCVFAIDKGNGNILAFGNEELIGKPYTDAGFPQDIFYNHTGNATVNGVSGYYVTDEYEGILLGTFYPKNEYYATRTLQLLLLCISMAVVFIVLILLINHLVNYKIVKGIHRITNGMSIITGGSLDVMISETGNPEFELLSSSINSMVDSIKKSMKENIALLDKQRYDMEENLALVYNIKSVCGIIDNISQETLSIASSIHAGSDEQAEAVHQLSGIMEELSMELKKSAGTSLEIADNSMISVSEMEKTNTKINMLYESIEEIADTTSKIHSIIKNIDDIASQTNMLALNATIEASRAGEQGRGFAVVAEQVSELAAKCTRAAKETAGLINNTMAAVNKGENIAENALHDFVKVKEDIKAATDSIGNLTDLSNHQVKTVIEAVDSLHQISNVVEKNAAVSVESKNTSSKLAEEAKKLREMVE